MKFKSRVVKIKGGKVLLRKTKLTDARELNVIFNTPSVNRFLLYPPSTLKGTRDSISRSLQPKWLSLVSVLEGKIVGRITLRPGRGRSSHTAEFGIFVHPGFQGRGIAKAMANALFETAKENGIEKINSEHFADNKASAAFHKSLGFKREGVRKKSIKRGGKYVDLILVGKWL